MNEAAILVLDCMAGAVLGAFFFVGLWWTIQKSVVSRRPALWVSGSMLLRVSVTVAGFYVVAGAHWERWLVCMLGFVMSRAAVISLTRLLELQRARRAGGPPCA